MKPDVLSRDGKLPIVHSFERSFLIRKSVLTVPFARDSKFIRNLNGFPTKISTTENGSDRGFENELVVGTRSRAGPKALRSQHEQFDRLDRVNTIKC